MTDIELLSLVLFAWAGVATGMCLDARRELRLSKILMLHLVHDKDEREKFFDGFETVLASRRKRND
jgi:hypothetical protein